MEGTFQLLGRKFEVGSERENYMTVLRLTGELSKGVTSDLFCLRRATKSVIYFVKK